MYPPFFFKSSAICNSLNASPPRNRRRTGSWRRTPTCRARAFLQGRRNLAEDFKSNKFPSAKRSAGEHEDGLGEDDRHDARKFTRNGMKEVPPE
jgi:hypothetical protein